MQAASVHAGGMQELQCIPAKCRQELALCLTTELSNVDQMQVQQKVDRLVAIWEERKVFGQSGTQPFKELVTAAEAPKLPGAPFHSHALWDDWSQM